MKERIQILAILTAMVTLTVSCVPTTPAAPVEPAATAEPTSAIPTPGPTDPTSLARQALADHIDASVDQIEVVDSTRDTFPLDNLGCPGQPEDGVTRPGMVVGDEVTLRVNGQTYVYRVHGRQVVLCEGPVSSDG